MKELPTLIYAALGTHHDQSARQQAEGSLQGFWQANPGEFLLECSHIIVIDAYGTLLRSLANTVLSRSVLLMQGQTSTLIWDRLPPLMKNLVKQNIVSALMGHDQVVMRSCANSIACIAALQLPRGQWPHFMSDISGSKHSPPCCRKGAISTLGYLLRHLPLAQVKSYTDQVFCFLIQQIRHEPQLSNNAYESLVQFASCCYDSLTNYQEQLVEVTLTALRSSNHCRVMALQLWDTIGREYLKRIDKDQESEMSTDNYLQAANDRLLQQIVKCVAIYDQEDLLDIERRQLALSVLGTFAKACNEQFAASLTRIIIQMSKSSEEGVAQACVSLLSALCSEKDETSPYIEEGLSCICPLLQSQSELILKNSLSGLTKLSKAFPKTVVSSAQFLPIVNSLFKLGTSGSQKELCLLALKSLDGMTEAMKDHEPAQNKEKVLNLIVPYHSSNIKDLAINSQIGERIVVIIMNTVDSMPNNDLISKYMYELIAKLNELILNQHQNVALQMEHMFLILNSVVLTLKDSIKPEIMQSLIQLVVSYVDRFGVNWEGLNTISSIVNAFQDKSKSHFKYLWKYVVKGMQENPNTQTFIWALTCVGDYSRSFKGQFEKVAKYMMNRLIGYFDNSMALGLKSDILRCMADLFHGMKASTGASFIGRVLKIIDMCFETCYECLSSQKYPQDLDCFQGSIVDIYACMVFTVETNSLLLQHYPILAGFIVRTCSDSPNPSTEYLKNCVYLLFDAASFLSIKNSTGRRYVSLILRTKEVKEVAEIFKRRKQADKQVKDFIEYSTSVARRRRH